MRARRRLRGPSTGPAALAVGLGLLCACSPGPGRPPMFEDLGVPRDARPAPDAPAPPDAGPFEVGDVGIGVTDFGPPPSFPFSGVYGAQGSSEPLLAREIAGRVVIVVGGAPYVYAGPIDAEGRIDLRSRVLERSGCPQATLTGIYGRESATFELEHVTCDARGQRVQSDLRGGFRADFVSALSGVYEGTASEIVDPGGCAAGLSARSLLQWGLGVLDDGRALLVTVVDPIDEPFAYLGRVSNGGLALFAPVAAGSAAQEVTFQGQVQTAGGGEPAGLSGRRDAFRPVGAAGCIFTMVVDLTRTRAP